MTRARARLALEMAGTLLGPKAGASLDRVEIRLIPDATTQAAEASAGRVDLIMNVARDQAEQLRTLPHLQVIASESPVVTYLQFNTLPTTPSLPLRDVRMRRARVRPAALCRGAPLRRDERPRARAACGRLAAVL